MQRLKTWAWIVCATAPWYAGATAPPQAADSTDVWQKAVANARKGIDYRHYAWAKPPARHLTSSNSEKLQAGKPAPSIKPPTPAPPISTTRHIKISSDSTEYVLVKGNILRPKTPSEIAADQAVAKARADRQNMADKLLVAGNFKRARPIYEEELREDPGDRRATTQLAEICLKEGKTDELYALTVGSATKYSDRLVLLWTSLAVALHGDSLPGQRDFLMKTAFYGCDDPSALGPADSSARTMKILSSLALACVNDAGYASEPKVYYFLDRTLRLDPNNTTAHDLRGKIALRHRRFAEAASEFKIVVERANGPLKDEAQRNLDIATALGHGK